MERRPFLRKRREIKWLFHTYLCTYVPITWRLERCKHKIQQKIINANQKFFLIDTCAIGTQSCRPQVFSDLMSIEYTINHSADWIDRHSEDVADHWPSPLPLVHHAQKVSLKYTAACFSQHSGNVADNRPDHLPLVHHRSETISEKVTAACAVRHAASLADDWHDHQTQVLKKNL